MNIDNTVTQENNKPQLPRVVFDGELSYGTMTRHCRILEAPDDFIFEMRQLDALGGLRWVPMLRTGMGCIAACLALVKVTEELTITKHQIQGLLEANIKLREVPATALEINADKRGGFPEWRCHPPECSCLPCVEWMTHYNAARVPHCDT